MCRLFFIQVIPFYGSVIVAKFKDFSYFLLITLLTNKNLFFFISVFEMFKCMFKNFITRYAQKCGNQKTVLDFFLFNNNYNQTIKLPINKVRINHR